MPITTPVLDDRTYAELRDELVARIPVYAPEWSAQEGSKKPHHGLTLFLVIVGAGIVAAMVIAARRRREVPTQDSAEQG